ncbi:MAG: prepilin-type N-terminal cleavage/methylation domain-containing protein [Deltaproteobacteria bacterium]|nr:prepilin-type N-terminal cleavage/methylation domain-containing protein [Deltaproteobacteria bacterium]
MDMKMSVKRHVDRALRSEGGFSVVELLIAIFITGIIAGAMYTLYTNFFRQTAATDLTVEAQQNARAAINIMERELLNAGYAADTEDIISVADADEVEFTYKDPATLATVSPTATKRLKVKYHLSPDPSDPSAVYPTTDDGTQYYKLVRTVDDLTDASDVPQPEEIVPYIQKEGGGADKGLQLTYYDINGNVVADTSTVAARKNIKFISVKLITITRAKEEGAATHESFTMETHVRLRNIGVGSSGTDATPPAAPTGVQVRDPGVCGRLKLKWTKNTEGDLAGYKVYYGVTSGGYNGIINIPASVLTSSTYSCSEVGSSIECTVYPSSPALAYTPSTTAAGSGTHYYIAVKAYDNSLNFSDFSTEVSGDPATSNPAFDSGGNDSTLNPVKPPLVTAFTAANGATEGQVALSWAAYDTTNYPDVVGFRIYRSTSAFSSYPVDPAAAGIDWIAGEPGGGKPEIAQSATSYTDVGPSLTGCMVYYYAIAPVNCDATLIPDDGGDPSSKKYIQTDYAATCGDGASACTPGTGFSAVSGSDTAPNETTAPSAPVIDARAGWKRVALSLTQPASADLDQTCLYENDSATYPALLTDTDAYPRVSKCYQVNTTSTPNSRLVPDSGGIFTVSELAQGQSTSFWHDSMTVENPGTPSLAETGTYSYRAVSFDLCGNGSPPTSAQATTILCGEDPASGEKPPAVAGASASCCSSPASLTWTGVSSDTGSPSTPTNPYDLAGYRIFRSSSVDFTGSTMVSGSAPFWGTTYNDATVSDGGTYYYRIVSTDCPYERNNPSEATIKSDMLSGYLNSTLVGPVKPGMLDRDEKCVGSSGSCFKDDHREVLTGVDVNNSSGTGTNSTTPKSSYKHNTVTMFLSNSSAGTMTITNATVSWVNSSAYLREIKVGGGRSGMGTFSTSIDASATAAVSGTPPYSSGVTNVALTTTQVPASARYVPITFEFKDASGNAVDMRDDQLLITLKVTNDATSTTGCLSYLTVSQSLEGVFVPFGPSISATQQNKPSSPTFSYAVPGSTGLNAVTSGVDGPVIVGSGVSVAVTANIAGNTTHAVTGSKVTVTSAKLYYKVTAKTTTTAPTSGFTEVTMTNPSGNTWTGTIPANEGFRMWYYIVATDADGNWDRDPEISDGAYVYDQENFDVCDVTPSAPTNLSAVPSGSDVALSWTAATTYTNGATIDTGVDPIKYRIYRGGTQIGTDQSGTTYSDTGLANGVYSYYVKALNSCASPGPNVSAQSNTAAACVGASGQATLSVSPTSIYRGESYTVTIVDCLAINGAYSATTEVINTTSGFTGFTNTSTAPGSYSPTITETGPATGTFTKTITTTSDVTDSTKLLTLATDTVTVTYPYASPSSKTVSVVVDPCTNTPKAPTGFTGAIVSNNAELSWTAVTQNTDNSAITDLVGYKIYERVCAKNKPDCTGADIVAEWFLRSTVAAGTTTAVLGPDQGNWNQRIYYFKATAYDSCATPKESAYSGAWNETN